MGRHVRDNPLPYALIGAGVAWLLWTSRGGQGEPAGSYASYGGRGVAGPSDFRGPATPYATPYPPGGRYASAAPDEGRRYPGATTRAGYGLAASTGGGAVENLAGRAHEAGSSVQRVADEAEDAFHGRVYDAKGKVLGLSRSVSETLAAFRERVDAAVSSAAEQYAHWRDRATSAGGDAAQGLADRGRSAADAAAGYGRSAYDTASGYGRSAYDRARTAGGGTVDFLQEQPLLLGALGVAVGAVIAMLIPSSRYERRFAGGLREEVQDRLADVASGTLDSAGRVASAVMGTAREAADREGLADLKPQGVASSARGATQDAASRVRTVVEDTAHAGREALERELAAKKDEAGAGGGSQQQNGRGGNGGQGRDEARTAQGGSVGGAPAGGGGAGSGGQQQRRTPA